MQQLQPLDYRFHLGESAWDLDFHSITVDESIELTKLTGSKWLPLINDFDQRDALAVKAFFWLARKKSGEQIQFDGEAMNFTWSQFRVEQPEPEQPEPEEETPDPTPATSGKTSRKK